MKRSRGIQLAISKGGYTPVLFVDWAAIPLWSDTSMHSTYRRRQELSPPLLCFLRRVMASASFLSAWAERTLLLFHCAASTSFPWTHSLGISLAVSHLSVFSQCSLGDLRERRWINIWALCGSWWSLATQQWAAVAWSCCGNNLVQVGYLLTEE